MTQATDLTEWAFARAGTGTLSLGAASVLEPRGQCGQPRLLEPNFCAEFLVPLIDAAS